MLTNEQTFDLLNQAKNGDDLAKEKLITLNSPLIKSVIKRYLNKGIEYDDLYQLGALGFVKAINNYDANFNVKFTTYAVPMIAGEIKRFLRDDGSVKVSRSIKHTAILIKNFIYEYNKKYGDNPTLEQLSNEFKMDTSEIVFAMEANTTPLSLNEKFNEVQELKKELASVQKENEQLKVSIENGLNLNNIEKLAKEKLGMQKLTNKQTVYVNLPKKDYVEPATEEIVEDEEKSWFEQFIDNVFNKK